MWFKRGDLDVNANPEPSQGEELAEADLLPIEDRYLDDGQLRPEDSLAYGLHTGRTQAIMPRPVPDNLGVDEAILIGEMKRGRRLYLALLAGGAAMMGALLFLL
jgi:hypothetical protein